jgi:hypothetical protein
MSGKISDHPTGLSLAQQQLAISMRYLGIYPVYSVMMLSISVSRVHRMTSPCRVRRILNPYRACQGRASTRRLLIPAVFLIPLDRFWVR